MMRLWLWSIVRKEFRASCVRQFYKSGSEIKNDWSVARKYVKEGAKIVQEKQLKRRGLLEKSFLL